MDTLALKFAKAQPAAQAVKPRVRALGRAPRRALVVPVAAVADESLGSAVRQLQASKELASGVPNAPVPPPVPGAEILPTPPPETLPEPSQGMDFVLDQLREKPPSGEGATLPAALTGGLDGAADALTGATKGLTEGAATAASQASAAAAEAAGAVSGVVGEGVSTAAAAASAAAAGVAGQVGGIAASAGDLVGKAQQEADAVVGNMQSNVSSLISSVQAAVSEAITSTTGQIEAQYTGVVNQLPPGVRDVLVAAASAAGAAVHAVAADPATGAAALGAAVALPAVLLWRAAYGGFAGTLSPDKALAMLQSQDALLLDVRSEAKRLEAGVPELKRGARGKGVALPPVQLLPSLARRVRSADELAVEILGAAAASLARAGPGTRLVVMDERGERGKAVARAATAAGVRRAYVLNGGFKAWQAAGLRVAERASEYDASPLGAVADAAESVVESATGTLGRPVAAAAAVGGLAAAVLAVLNYHVLLRFIGVAGVEATIVLRVLQYNSPQDALDDVAAARDSLARAASLPLQAAQGVAGLLGQGQRQQPQQLPPPPPPLQQQRQLKQEEPEEPQGGADAEAEEPTVAEPVAEAPQQAAQPQEAPAAQEMPQN